MRLVADIGGTSTRLALLPIGSTKITDSRKYQNIDFACFEDVIADFLESKALPKQLVVAMAGPVTNNSGRLTNLNWVVDSAKLSAQFEGASVRVINDLTALGYASLNLAPDQVLPVAPSPAPASAQAQALVVGIGTGFNVSPIVSQGATTICPAAEAGHTSLFVSLANALDDISPKLSAEFPSIETLFSGRGRRKFVSLVTGTQVDRVTPLIENQGKSGNEAADAALDVYAKLIGILLAELKIMHLPTHGMFLAGGIARSSLTGPRAKICADWALRPNEVIKITPPIYMIDDDAAALIGCASLAI